MIICLMYRLSLIAILLTFLPIINCEVAQIFKRRPTVDLATGVNVCVNPVSNANQKISTGNCQNYLYYIQMGIGTPPQNFYFQVDTGSYVQWIPLNTTKSNGFVASKSSSLQMSSKAGTITYADLSSVSGMYGTDNVTVQPLINIR